MESRERQRWGQGRQVLGWCGGQDEELPEPLGCPPATLDIPPTHTGSLTPGATRSSPTAARHRSASHRSPPSRSVRHAASPVVTWTQSPERRASLCPPPPSPSSRRPTPPKHGTGTMVTRTAGQDGATMTRSGAPTGCVARDQAIPLGRGAGWPMEFFGGGGERRGARGGGAPRSSYAPPSRGRGAPAFLRDGGLSERREGTPPPAPPPHPPWRWRSRSHGDDSGGGGGGGGGAEPVGSPPCAAAWPPQPSDRRGGISAADPTPPSAVRWRWNVMVTATRHPSKWWRWRWA